MSAFAEYVSPLKDYILLKKSGPDVTGEYFNGDAIYKVRLEKWCL